MIANYALAVSCPGSLAFPTLTMALKNRPARPQSELTKIAVTWPPSQPSDGIDQAGGCNGTPMPSEDDASETFWLLR